MLHTETVEPSTLDLLKRLQRLPDLANTRLVGGTALALHLGHRKSVDLDMFGAFDPIVSYRKLLADAGYSVEGAENGTHSFPLRGLMYFDDAEEDPMPEMFDGNLTWENVKKKIIDTTRAFVLRGNV